MKAIENLLEETIELCNTDEKQQSIANEPKLIFKIGYNFFLINRYFKKYFNIEEIYKYIEEEDYYSIYKILIKLNKYYLEQSGKYGF